MVLCVVRDVAWFGPSSGVVARGMANGIGLCLGWIPALMLIARFISPALEAGARNECQGVFLPCTLDLGAMNLVLALGRPGNSSDVE